jgi:hypothetical protein
MWMDENKGIWHSMVHFIQRKKMNFPQKDLVPTYQFEVMIF